MRSEAKKIKRRPRGGVQGRSERAVEDRGCENVKVPEACAPGFEIRICSCPSPTRGEACPLLVEAMVRRALSGRMWRKIRVWLPLQVGVNV